MVVDSDGTAYLSVKTVPAGVDISNTDYWQPIFNYDDNINGVRASIAANEKGSTTATAARSIGDLVYLNGILYKVTTPMAAGSAYIIDTNCVKYTVSDRIKDLQILITQNQSDIGTLQDNIGNEVRNRENADATLQANIDNEARNRENADTALQTNIDNETRARESSDNELKNKINQIVGSERYIIFIGDSYGDNPRRTYLYPNVCAETMGLDSEHCFNLCLSGSGFIGDGIANTFLQQLATFTNNRPKVTDIVVLGGTNDFGKDETALTSAVATFMTFAKTNFKNAKIHVGTLSWAPIFATNMRKYLTCRKCYLSAVKYGALIVDDMLPIIHIMENMEPDGNHPNDAGELNIGRALASYLKGGSMYIFPDFTDFVLTPKDNITISNFSGYDTMTYKTSIVNMSGKFTFGSPINIGSAFPLASKTTGFTRGGYGSPSINITATCTHSSGQQITYDPAKILFSEGTLYIYPFYRWDNVTSVDVSFVFECPLYVG